LGPGSPNRSTSPPSRASRPWYIRNGPPLSKLSLKNYLAWPGQDADDLLHRFDGGWFPLGDAKQGHEFFKPLVLKHPANLIETLFNGIEPLGYVITGLRHLQPLAIGQSIRRSPGVSSPLPGKKMAYRARTSGFAIP
jgi:hypothetical protein